MSTRADWVRAYAKQAEADLRLYHACRDVSDPCQRLMLLQMACEKACKAHLIDNGAAPHAVKASHAFVAGPLPVIIRAEARLTGRSYGATLWITDFAMRLGREIELLNPSVLRDGRRPDNCEYPWEDAAGAVVSPLDFPFTAEKLVETAPGRDVLALLASALARLS